MKRCTHCSTPLADDEAHDVHECDGDTLDGWPCDCDRYACAACCAECNKVAVLPGQLDLLGGAA